MDDDKQLREWRKKAYACPKLGKKKHEWIPIANIKTDRVEHVSMLMCGACFLQINVQDTHRYCENIFEEASPAFEVSDDFSEDEESHNIFG